MAILMSLVEFSGNHSNNRRRIGVALTCCVVALTNSACLIRQGGGGGTSGGTAAQPSAPATGGLGGAAPVQNAAGEPSNYGTIQISHGFQPDPSTHGGTSGGALNSQSAVDPACRGWIAQRPDHILQLDSAFDYMRLEAAATQDTTIVVRGPGGIRCDDDSAGNRNPRIDGSWAPGRYEVWIGSYQQGEFSRYQLTATEYRVQGAPTAAAAPTGNVTASTDGPSRYQAAQLQPGFQPDPVNLEGQAGGQMDVHNTFAQCRGWIASDRPDHQITLTQAFNYLRLEAVSSDDTTLVVQGPGGTLCDDDTAGNRNPRVESALPAGVYNVWVGSYNQGRFSRYQLQLTERHAAAAAAAPATGAGFQAPVAPTGTVQANPEGPSRYATAQIVPGFQPDPTALEGQSGGQMDVHATVPACRGWIASDRPDHQITLSQPFGYLRLEAVSSDDTTLVVQGPTGTVCDDDSAGNRNPRIEGAMPAGTYKVWVGSYNQGRFSRYQLQVTERRVAAAPPTSGVGFQAPASGNGFVPPAPSAH